MPGHRLPFGFPRPTGGRELSRVNAGSESWHFRVRQLREHCAKGVRDDGFIGSVFANQIAARRSGEIGVDGSGPGEVSPREQSILLTNRKAIDELGAHQCGGFCLKGLGATPGQNTS